MLEQIGSKIEMINIEARNSFYHRTTPSLLKCVAKFNYHGTRNQIINQRLTSSQCPYYFMNKDWMHIVQCKVIDNQQEFIKGLHKKLTKVVNNENSESEIITMLNDIVQVLKNKTNY